MFNWLQKKSGRTDRGVFVREQASYIVNHYLGPQLAAVLYGIAHDMELDRAGLGAAAEQGFGSMQIEPPASGAPMPAGLNRTLALEISIAPAGDRPDGVPRRPSRVPPGPRPELVRYARGWRRHQSHYPQQRRYRQAGARPAHTRG